MNTISLEGSWTLSSKALKQPISGHLPGCQYLDLLDNRLIEDPFYGTNESQSLKWAESDYDYSRTFELTAHQLDMTHIDLELSGVDTLGTISINDQIIGKTENIHRTYRWSIKHALKIGTNTIHIHLTSPIDYVTKCQSQDPIPFSANFGLKGIAHIRKTQSHFGWDWGPILPPMGVSGHLLIEVYDHPKISDLRIHQHHTNKHVDLDIFTEFDAPLQNGPYELRALLTHPDGHITQESQTLIHETTPLQIAIDKPSLWWCNGLGDQPLYALTLELLQDEEILQSMVKNIGLRTLTLDTSDDAWGKNFRFVINGVPIFAKGADWIPSDIFITRTDDATLRDLIQSTKDGNMNMLRVWGGGYYESDRFYDLCDRMGILVWQDFAFACSPYPFYNDHFVENVHMEVIDNVKRLRHRASLALWCGNNEIDMMSMMWKKHKKIYHATHDFFHETLAGWLPELDDDTPYWPGSPTSGIKRPKPNAFTEGDTHLWQVWHGLMPIEAFQKMPTRFCSEFGMESLPSLEAIESFTPTEELTLFDPVMLAHQKSAGGNQKMLFYLLAKYREPSNLEDFIYLSQIVQSETIREATEGWKRHIGRSNGAIYWQLNDCWPVASWAGIDYTNRKKAVVYRNQSVNAMVTANLEVKRQETSIYVINEYGQEKDLSIHYELMTFDGQKVHEETRDIHIGAVTSLQAYKIKPHNLIGSHKLKDLFIRVTILEDEMELFVQTRLLIPDKKARLLAPKYQWSLVEKDQDTYELTIHAKTFMRYVAVHVPDMVGHLSDNYMDLTPGQSKKLTFTLKHPMAADALLDKIQLKCLNDLPYKGNPLTDFITRWRMRLHKSNFFSWIIFKFI